MVTWYLLLILGTPATKPSIYATENDACQAYTAMKTSSPVEIFKVSGKRDSPQISEGDCKPVQQFTQK
jgi:hypothetical protein